MFPYLTTGLKKVWAAITALQSSLANVQSGAVRFLDYSNPVENKSYMIRPRAGFDAIAGICILNIINNDSKVNSTVAISVNNNNVFNFELNPGESKNIQLPFKGGEYVALGATGNGAIMYIMAIPFAAN